MATKQLVDMLMRSLSDDVTKRETARRFMEKINLRNLPIVLTSLSEIVANKEMSDLVRQAAGLQIKNQLMAKNEVVRKSYQQRWHKLPENTRELIKLNILKALGTEETRPSCAAQCVAAVAIIELPINRWDALLETLIRMVVDEANTTAVNREFGLKTIGYICKDIRDEGVLENQSKQILICIMHGMRQLEPSLHVRLAAIEAMIDFLPFTSQNMENRDMRDLVMDVVCEAAQATYTDVRAAALKCATKIVSHYYPHMEAYMSQMLFHITIEGMQSDDDKIVEAATNFWAVVIDEEIDLEVRKTNALNEGGQINFTSKHYARGALPYLAPVLLENILKDNDLPDCINESKEAASICLCHLATCCEDEIVAHIFPFVEKHIDSKTSRYRGAAVMAFGAIIHGLDSNNSKTLVETIMPQLIRTMYDDSESVRYTTSWCFIRICNIIPEAVINETYLKSVLDCFIAALKTGVARVAANVCVALISLSDAAHIAALVNNDEAPETYAFSPYFEWITQNILQISERADCEQDLHGASYEALIRIVTNAGKDCCQHMRHIALVILQRLKNAVDTISEDIATERDLVHSMLSFTICCVLRKLREVELVEICDKVMCNTLEMLNSVAGKSVGMHEDAYIIMSTLIQLRGEHFARYMELLKNYLYHGLEEYNDFRTCDAALGVVADICQYLNADTVTRYSHEFMHLMVTNLKHTDLHYTLKPKIITTFGCIATNIGVGFDEYLDLVMNILHEICKLEIDDAMSHDKREHFKELHKTVLETFICILHSLTHSRTEQQINSVLTRLAPYLWPFVGLIKRIVLDHSKYSNAVIVVVVGCICDLLKTCGTVVYQNLNNSSVLQFLRKEKNSKEQLIKDLCIEAIEHIQQLSLN